MGRLKYTYLTFAFIMFSLFSSCTKEDAVVPQENVTKFILETKAPAEVGTTFRVMAYGRQEDNLFNVVSTGTYSLLDGREFGGVKYLSASELSDDGVFVSEDQTKALAIPYEELYRENFFVTYISPGKIHQEGGFEIDLSSPFYCSDVQDIKLYNYGVVEINKELVDRRAKIGFQIYKEESDILVENFRVEGAGNFYWPATKQVTPKDASLDFSTLLKQAEENTENLVYECTDEDMPFILSGFYAPKDSVAARISNNQTDYNLGFEFDNSILKESGYLLARFDLTVNGFSTEMLVPLSKQIIEILPLTTYMYKITISHAYIHTILEVAPIDTHSWEDVVVDFEIDDKTVTIDLGIIELSGWEDANWGDIEIDDPYNN